MSDASWRLIQWADCPKCNGEMIAKSGALCDYVDTGDKVRCCECNFRGVAVRDDVTTETTFKDSRHAMMDHTVRELGDAFGRVSGTTGKTGISFIVASGDAAKKLDRYIARSK